MKIWFKDTDPTVVVGIGQGQGKTGESYFDHTQTTSDGRVVDGDLLYKILDDKGILD